MKTPRRAGDTVVDLQQENERLRRSVEELGLPNEVATAPGASRNFVGADPEHWSVCE